MSRTVGPPPDTFVPTVDPFGLTVATQTNAPPLGTIDQGEKIRIFRFFTLLIQSLSWATVDPTGRC